MSDIFLLHHLLGLQAQKALNLISNGEVDTVCPQLSSGQRWNAGAESLVDIVLGSSDNDPQRPSTLAAVGKGYTLDKQSRGLL